MTKLEAIRQRDADCVGPDLSQRERDRRWLLGVVEKLRARVVWHKGDQDWHTRTCELHRLFVDGAECECGLDDDRAALALLTAPESE